MKIGTFNLDNFKLEDLKLDLNTFNTKLKATWDKLTDEDLKSVNGKADVLIAKVTERYGITKDEAQKKVTEFFTTLMPK